VSGTALVLALSLLASSPALAQQMLERNGALAGAEDRLKVLKIGAPVEIELILEVR
jgi:hypothetical protein